MSDPKFVMFEELWDRGVLYTRRHVDRLEADKKFPERVTLGVGRVGWVTIEIDAWVKKKIAARSKAGRSSKRSRRSAAAAPAK